MRTLGLPELLVLCGTLFLLGFGLFLLVAALRWKQSRSVQRALIDKLSSNELAGLLQTPQGEKLMQGLAEAAGSPGRSILASVQRGIVVTMTGFGLLVVAIVSRSAALTRSQTPDVVPAIAIVIIFVGVGLLLAAFVSYRLSKRWRLLEENGGKRRAD